MNNYGQKSVSDSIEFSKKGPKIKKILDDLFGTYENNESNLARIQGKDPVNAQDFVTKTFLETFAQEKIEYAIASNTDTLTNLNTNTSSLYVPNVPLFGNTATSDGTNDFEFLNSTDLQCNFDGLIVVMVSIHWRNGSGSRNNVAIRVKNGTTPEGPVGASGYIRNSNGQDESSCHLSYLYSVSDGDIIRVGARREANSGSVYMNAVDTSALIALRIR